MPTRLPLRSVMLSDAVVGDQLEASGVQPAKHLDGHAGVDRCEMDRHVVHAEIRLAACDPHRLDRRLVSPCT